MSNQPASSHSALPFSDMPFNLDQLHIAAPCPADWNAMTPVTPAIGIEGNDPVRFCGQCQLNVYNLSGMTRAAAEKLVQTQEGRLCVRLFRRLDGTVITQDCPVGVEIQHKKRLKKAFQVTRFGGKVAAVMSLITIAGLYTANVAAQAGGVMPPPSKDQQSREKMGEMTLPKVTPKQQQIMGDVAIPPTQQEKGRPAIPFQGNVANPPEMIMGKPTMPPINTTPKKSVPKTSKVKNKAKGKDKP